MLVLLMQALQNTQKLQEASKFSAVAAVLGTAYLLGQGTDFLSVPVLASFILGAASSSQQEAAAA